MEAAAPEAGVAEGYEALEVVTRNMEAASA
jgi:hypothetical protein